MTIEFVSARLGVKRLGDNSSLFHWILYLLFILKLEKMDIEYGTPVVDKKGKSIGEVDYIIMDSWSGEPRKFMVRREQEDDAVFFTPEQVDKLTKKKVTLNVAVEELDQT